MDKTKKKALIYKAMQQKQSAGVFLIYNNISKNHYLGTSMNIEKVFNRHALELKIKTHHNKKMQEDWNLYGEASFNIQILIEASEDRIIDFAYLKKLEEEAFQKFLKEGIIPERLLQ